MSEHRTTRAIRPFVLEKSAFIGSSNRFYVDKAPMPVNGYVIFL